MTEQVQRRSKALSNGNLGADEHLDGSEDQVEQQLRAKAHSFYNRRTKRALSLILAVPLILLVSPLLALIAIAIVIDSGLPVFYRAERGGFRGRSFRIMKFRTMVKGADRIGGGTTALHDSRITRIGSILRRTKLDEFPQLVNILKGEMCFVGPRPELPQYTNAYQGVEKYILHVRPGITDFSSLEYIALDAVVGQVDADVTYENEVLPKKNALRIEYVARMSLATDTRLFIKTIFRSVQQGVAFFVRRS